MDRGPHVKRRYGPWTGGKKGETRNIVGNPLDVDHGPTREQDTLKIPIWSMDHIGEGKRETSLESFRFSK